MNEKEIGVTKDQFDALTAAIDKDYAEVRDAQIEGERIYRIPDNFQQKAREIWHKSGQELRYGFSFQLILTNTGSVVLRQQN